MWVIVIFAIRPRNAAFMSEADEQIGLNSGAENNTNREEINTKLMKRGPIKAESRRTNSRHLPPTSPGVRTAPFKTLAVSSLHGVECLDDALIRNDLEGRNPHLTETSWEFI
jgi:hypothetical protein